MNQYLPPLHSFGGTCSPPVKGFGGLGSHQFAHNRPIYTSLIQSTRLSLFLPAVPSVSLLTSLFFLLLISSFFPHFLIPLFLILLSSSSFFPSSVSPPAGVSPLSLLFLAFTSQSPFLFLSFSHSVSPLPSSLLIIHLSLSRPPSILLDLLLSSIYFFLPLSSSLFFFPLFPTFPLPLSLLQLSSLRPCLCVCACGPSVAVVAMETTDRRLKGDTENTIPDSCPPLVASSDLSKGTGNMLLIGNNRTGNMDW